MECLLKTDIPSKLSVSRNKLPWINTELKRQIRKKGRRFSKAKKSGSKEDWDNYKAMEKDVKCNLKMAETNFLQTILTTGLESDDTRPFWKYPSKHWKSIFFRNTSKNSSELSRS